MLKPITTRAIGSGASTEASTNRCGLPCSGTINMTWRLRRASRSDWSYLKVEPSGTSLRVLARTLPSMPSRIMSLALMRLPWLSSTERIVAESPLATASRKPKSAANSCTPSARRRPRTSSKRSKTRAPTSNWASAWLRTAELVAALTLKYSAPITTSNSRIRTLATRAWKLLRSFTGGSIEGIAKGTWRRRKILGRRLQGQHYVVSQASGRHVQGTAVQGLHIRQLRVP